MTKTHHSASSSTTLPRLIVFGATRGTGRELVQDALTQGHRVTAFGRSIERLSDLEHHPGLTLVRGDVTDKAAVRAAIKGHDVVLSALGASAFSRAQLREVGTQNIVDAMEASGGGRLISLSVLGAGESWDELPFHIKHIVVPLYLKRAYADHNAQEDVIRRSSLSWVIVRPPFLTNADATGRYQHGKLSELSSPTMKVSRADVAHFMLEQARSDQYLGGAPAISY